MPDYVVRRLMMALNERERPVNGARILLLGLAYKKNTGDARESPAVRVAELLRALGRRRARGRPARGRGQRRGRAVPRVEPTPDELAAADVVVLLTDHDAFDVDAIRTHARYVFDCRRQCCGHRTEKLR